MAFIIWGKGETVSIYEFDPERPPSGCRFNIIEVPKSIFKPEYLEQIKRENAPVKIESND